MKTAPDSLVLFLMPQEQYANATDLTLRLQLPSRDRD
jgi:hypothetical protein